MSDAISTFLFYTLQVLAMLFLLALVVAGIVIATMYVVDVSQKRHAIRRNYPVIGRFRYAFEHLGEFFRQYFFAMDREELPFNRAQRSWCYRAAKNIDTTVAFGSTKNLRTPGCVIFVNCAYPTLTEDAVEPRPITIGPHCAKPFTTASIFNISGMSYGAISRPRKLTQKNLTGMLSP